MHLAASKMVRAVRKDTKLEDPHGGAKVPQQGAARSGEASTLRQDRESQPNPVLAGTVTGYRETRDGQPQNDPGKRSRRRRRRKRGREVDAPATQKAEAPSVAKPKSKRRRRKRGNATQPPLPNPKLQSAGNLGGEIAMSAGPIVAPAPQADSRAGSRPDLFAALDLGTNNCRLLIASPTRPGQFRVVDAFSRIVRLGEGLTANGRLGEGAMDRAIEALKICSDKLANRKIFMSRLIATEACRAAENGESFLERVTRETGLELEIVDRETEARLAVSGCGPLVNREIEAVVLFDIGGGSSEIALIDLKHRKSPHLSDHIIAWTSLPVGVVSLAERFGGRDVSRETYQAMVDDVLGMIERFSARHILGVRAKGDKFHLLGTSGTVTTLAGIHLGLERYDRRQVDGLWMESGDVTAMTEKLMSWSFDERVNNACIGAERADLVLGGCAILDAIRQTWPSERLRVGDRGLREGLLTEMMSSAGVWRRRALQETRQ
jgi:exopolyphosphatase / guanosine-5'-triphosphate,3'-diphosphate pyrophosphatase